jgi:glycerate kinase
VLGDGATAVIEMASASRLPLVPPERRDPRLTTTFGTGELITDGDARGGSRAGPRARSLRLVAEEATGRCGALRRGAGATGGLAAGLLLFTPALLVPGVDPVLETARACRLVAVGAGLARPAE